MDRSLTIALFGEAEKGLFSRAYYFDSLPQLVDHLGNPPEHSQGLYLAVQALLYERKLIFFRVEEEGFSYQDYIQGLRQLESAGAVPDVAAICLPGVGDAEIISAAVPVCRAHHAVILTTEPDFYDYLRA